MNRNLKIALSLIICAITFSDVNAQFDPEHPNILLVIADDLGVDVSNGYHNGDLMPTTPTLDSLRNVGITFENVFSAPVCSPTRAAVITGRFGNKNGVTTVPGNLALGQPSIFDVLAEETDAIYADAVIGKWHLASPLDPNHPNNHGADYYLGTLDYGVSDYFEWAKTENGSTEIETEYVTSVFTNAARSWIDNQTQPWLMWFAHVAPHSPYHWPPEEMCTIEQFGGNFRKYIAMIESVDYELNRLLSNMSEELKANTLVIYIGDNGTPNSVLQDYPNGHGKSSLYQGGIRVPMIVSGAGVSRQNERESALIHVNDIFATIIEVAGTELPGGRDNSLSFDHLFTNAEGATRDYNFSEMGAGNANEGYTVRNATYKLISFVDGTQEFYDLISDSLETVDLILGGLTTEQLAIKEDLELEAEQIILDWSCRDHIQNGSEEGIDCGGDYCEPCIVDAVSDLVNDGGVTLFPNPSNGSITIKSEQASIKDLKVYSTTGVLVFSLNNLNSHFYVLNVSAFRSQMLFIEVVTDTGSYTLKASIR